MLLLSSLVLILPALARAAPNCPVMGSSFPPTIDLSSSNTVIQSATTNLTNAINQAISTGNTSHGPFETKETAFSLQIFSTHSSDPIVDFHYTPPGLASNDTGGTKKVDANSVYRIGSATKLFVVYGYLVEAGDASWNDPITKYIPELKAAQQSHADDLIDFVQWDDITIGALATHMSGIGRDYAFGDRLIMMPGVNWTQFGLPTVNASDVLTCTSLTADCDRSKVTQGFSEQRPVFASFSSPVYSNLAFQLLGYAIEAITNKTVESIMQDRIFTALNMTSSSYTTPADSSNGVIPVNVNASWWTFDLYDEAPAGTIFSTANDITKLGKSILQSSLLTPAQTRRWMKPHTHTAKFVMSVGAPWEIRRYVNPTENRIIDIYTKGGDLGSYSSIIALIPEYDIGFGILSASTKGGDAHQNVEMLSGLIADILLPQLETSGRQAANDRFAGTYTDASTNSTVTLSAKDGQPGLYVDAWTSQGVNMFQDLILLSGQTTPPSVVLYPTTVFNATRYAFRADIEYDSYDKEDSTFSWSCLMNWVTMDSTKYAGRSIDDFVFELGDDGKATALQPRVTRTTLAKAPGSAPSMAVRTPSSASSLSRQFVRGYGLVVILFITILL